jgi:hypothetical protein
VVVVVVVVEAVDVVVVVVVVVAVVVVVVRVEVMVVEVMVVVVLVLVVEVCVCVVTAAAAAARITTSSFNRPNSFKTSTPLISTAPPSGELTTKLFPFTKISAAIVAWADRSGREGLSPRWGRILLEGKSATSSVRVDSSCTRSTPSTNTAPILDDVKSKSWLLTDTEAEFEAVAGSSAVLVLVLAAAETRSKTQ